MKTSLVAFCASAALSLTACVIHEASRPEVRASDVQERRVALEEAKAALEEERLRTAALEASEQSVAAREERVSNELVQLNAALEGLQEERRQLDLLEAQVTETEAHRARVQELENEIKALKGLISGYAPR